MKTYLGDGVYAELVNTDIVLTTEDGINVTNEIVLDHYVMKALLEFHAKYFSGPRSQPDA